MLSENDRQFGGLIGRLLRKENLSQAEARAAFTLVLQDGTTEMQQGAFLAALAAKGETAAEAAGAWEAIYLCDTNKVDLGEDLGVVENSGTGMDSFKTFNISTAASILVAAAGVGSVWPVTALAPLPRFAEPSIWPRCSASMSSARSTWWPPVSEKAGLVFSTA